MTDSVRLKWLLTESDVRAGADAGVLPLLSVSISWGVRRREASDMTTRAASEDLSNYKLCRAGDLVINRMRAFQGALGIAPEDGVVSPDYAVLRVDPRVDKRWLNYFLTSGFTVATMASLVRGIGGTEAGNVRTPRLNVSDLQSMTVPLVSADEQRAIADYLDRETTRIDTLIEEQRRLIEMLRERRASEIAMEFTEARRTPLRQVLEYAQTGPFGTQLTADEYVDNGIPVINPTHIQRGVIIPDDSITVTSEKAEELERYRLATGDIVLGRKGEVDKSALVDGRSAGYVCGSDGMVLRPAAGTVPDYLWWFLQSTEAHSQLEFWSVGATVSGLNQTTIRKVRLPLPGEQQQRRIASYLYEKTAKIDALISETLLFIELSQERRSALITAAVTGQIDVREMV
ncbi:restriction endonuclease subunit S [Rhodococcus sp. HNM0563]|uniref:restriction endonuclease subunit S n=1 Tax=Rhodococcus sp. HNM0563 TaxID=2716339 RepID=UPI00146F8007|nr:restriction endonuclease subunit S [Rhodococcus sp. HNM0563]NLU64950.1 restriction endonuclease subunit S [Rhodococcus sp. HNM0563]